MWPLAWIEMPPSAPVPVYVSVKPCSLRPAALLPPPNHWVRWPVYCGPSEVLITAWPCKVPPPQSPFLFVVPWNTALPLTRLSSQSGPERNDGQFGAIVTNGGG